MTVLVSLVLASAALAQTQGSYVTFGAGCPGTGGSPTQPGVVLPAGHDQKFGSYNNYWGVSRPQERYQQVFLASEVGRPTVFTGYQLRPDEQFPSATGGTQTYAVSLGYTLQTPATIGGTYATNYDTTHGAPTLVFQGNVNLPAVASSPAPKLDDWTFTVRFTAPWVFVYKPGDNLLFELANSSLATVSGQKDAANGVNANTTRVSTGSGPTSPSGSVYRNSGLVIKFMTLGGPVGAVPVLAGASLPNLGQTLRVTLAQAKSGAPAVFVLGFSTTMWGPFVLPLDLSAAGANGCSLLASIDLSAVVQADATGAAAVNLPIPNNPNLRNGRFHNQWIVLDSGANALGLAFSNGGTATIGG